MGLIKKFLPKIFAGKAKNNGIFGSAAAGNPTTIANGNVDTIQSLGTYDTGWASATEGGNKLPPLEEMQGVQYCLSYIVRYIMQSGIPEWHPQETYDLNYFCSHNGIIWYSLVNNNTGNEPVDKSKFWKAGGGAKGGGSMGPPGSIISYSGIAVPEGYLRCDGQTVMRSDYSDLYDAIGTMYNTGGESSSVFRLPNFNGEGVFLQGSSSAGTKRDAGLPNITGRTAVDLYGLNSTSGCFYNSSEYCGGGPGTGTAAKNVMDASRSSAVYGRSGTVQPPAMTVIFLISY
jgi:hypothetical protein